MSELFILYTLPVWLSLPLLGGGLVGLVGLVGRRVGRVVLLGGRVGVRAVVTGNLVVFFLSPNAGEFMSSKKKKKQQ